MANQPFCRPEAAVAVRRCNGKLLNDSVEIAISLAIFSAIRIAGWRGGHPATGHSQTLVSSSPPLFSLGIYVNVEQLISPYRPYAWLSRYLRHFGSFIANRSDAGAQKASLSLLVLHMAFDTGRTAQRLLKCSTAPGCLAGQVARCQVMATLRWPVEGKIKRSTQHRHFPTRPPRPSLPVVIRVAAEERLPGSLPYSYEASVTERYGWIQWMGGWEDWRGLMVVVDPTRSATGTVRKLVKPEKVVMQIATSGLASGDLRAVSTPSPASYQPNGAVLKGHGAGAGAGVGASESSRAVGKEISRFDVVSIPRMVYTVVYVVIEEEDV
ncbi:hypothetical protein HYFRA_00002397 [Hymenoscyphus fraxineus]|uniref:Uncharacterized protein n=1 Tax=Hymenoscyphus fraxineus TaxID=746836 RepID=A0A9N9PYY5_9HELO|nr:hypothetical protein HYFRA_00002397 [Hymenoscyphus fraxineus]